MMMMMMMTDDDDDHIGNFCVGCFIALDYILIFCECLLRVGTIPVGSTNGTLEMIGFVWRRGG